MSPKAAFVSTIGPCGLKSEVRWPMSNIECAGPVLLAVHLDAAVQQAQSGQQTRYY
jgi:hypothetical protein